MRLLLAKSARGIDPSFEQLLPTFRWPCGSRSGLENSRHAGKHFYTTTEVRYTPGDMPPNTLLEVGAPLHVTTGFWNALGNGRHHIKSIQEYKVLPKSTKVFSIDREFVLMWYYAALSHVGTRTTLLFNFTSVETKG